MHVDCTICGGCLDEPMPYVVWRKSIILGASRCFNSDSANCVDEIGIAYHLASVKRVSHPTSNAVRRQSSLRSLFGASDGFLIAR